MSHGTFPDALEELIRQQLDSGTPPTELITAMEEEIEFLQSLEEEEENEEGPPLNGG